MIRSLLLHVPPGGSLDTATSTTPPEESGPGGRMRSQRIGFGCTVAVGVGPAATHCRCLGGEARRPGSCSWDICGVCLARATVDAAVSPAARARVWCGAPFCTMSAGGTVTLARDCQWAPPHAGPACPGLSCTKGACTWLGGCAAMDGATTLASPATLLAASAEPGDHAEMLAQVCSTALL
jgi:hypothetical protein